MDIGVAPASRDRFDQLRDQVRSADDGQGLPEGLVHGNLMHAPDHVIVTDQGPVAIQWKGSGRGPRLADFAYLTSFDWRRSLASGRQPTSSDTWWHQPDTKYIAEAAAATRAAFR